MDVNFTPTPPNKHYAYIHSNRQLHIQYERKQFNKQFVKRYKSFLSCKDCGFTFKNREQCCDFHHLNPSLKVNTVGQLLTYSIDKIKQEIRKCVPLCANCHRIRHAH